MPNITIGNGFIGSGSGGSSGSLGAIYNASLPTYFSGQATMLQTDNNGRLIVAPFSLIFSAPLQTYPSVGVGSNFSAASLTITTTGVSAGNVPSGASALRVSLPPGANISFYVAAAVAANSTAAVVVSTTRNNASANTDAIVFDIPLNSQSVFITNVTVGTSTTYVSGQPILRFI